MITEQQILLTGAGSVGRSLIPRLLAQEPAELRVLDNDESGLAELGTRFDDDDRLQFLVGNVRDSSCVERAVENVDVVIHTAAMKHVDVCQSNPYEVVKTNVVGLQNVVDAAADSSVERVVFTSSDKAVNPANAMGTTKLLGEQLLTAGRHSQARDDLRLASVRFGNVINSSQSVIPRFTEQIREGGPLTLTDERMMRFFLTYDDVFDLVTGALEHAHSGEIFVYKMPAIRIPDLADAMIETVAPQYGYEPADIDVELIGRRPGETFHEEIMTAREERRAYETESLYAVQPEMAGEDSAAPDEFVTATDVVRSSADAEKLSTDEIVSLLSEAGGEDESAATHPVEA